jgi:hypothetical protein
MSPENLTRYTIIMWLQVVAGLGLAAVAAAQIVARRQDDYSGEGILIGLAAAQAVCGLGMAAAGFLNRHLFRTAHILLTPHGVINKQLRGRLIPWHTITAIDTIPRGGVWRIRLTLRGGLRTTLVAPLTRTSAPNPSFAADRDTLLGWWHHYRLR